MKHSSDVATSPPPLAGLRYKLEASLWLPLLMLVAGLAITFLLWRHEQQVVLQEQFRRFEFSVSQNAQLIEQHMQAIVKLLHGTQGLFVASEQVTREEFRAYMAAQQLETHYSGLQGVSFAPLVPAKQLNQHVATVRSQGLTGYTVSPAGQRPIYTPVMYIEPYTGRNLQVPGYDGYSDPVRRAAMEQARDTGRATLSGRVRLVQEGQQEQGPGILLFMPLYGRGLPTGTVPERRAAITGWLAASFRMPDLVRGLFGEQARDIDIEIFDGPVVDAGNLLYDSDGSRLAGRLRLPMECLRKFEIGGRTWTVSISPKHRFMSSFTSNKPQLIVGGGVVVTLLLSLLTWELATSRSRALTAAREMNRGLMEQETRYRQMFEENASVSYLLNTATGEIVDANAAAADFWGYTIEELRTMKITEINIATLEQLHKVWERAKEHGSYLLEWRHRLKNGEVRDVEVYGGPLTYHGQPLLYCITHDITERKRAEQALAAKQQQLEELNSSLEARVQQAVEELRRKDEILIQQSRQATLGEMINNIAHQWRQPLNSLGLVIQNVRYDYEADQLTKEQMAQDMNLGMELIQYMSQTINDFRNFFREDKQLQRFSVGESITRAVSLLGGSLASHSIRLVCEQEQDLQIDGYPNEYAQTLLNLLSNARDVLLERCIVDPLITISLRREGELAVVIIRDNAGGVPSAIANRIFDPYFTTKEQGQGTGIGLYMSKMIIERHMGGRLEFCNVADGAEFRISNPLPDEKGVEPVLDHPSGGSTVSFHPDSGR